MGLGNGDSVDAVLEFDGRVRSWQKMWIYSVIFNSSCGDLFASLLIAVFSFLKTNTF